MQTPKYAESDVGITEFMSNMEGGGEGETNVDIDIDADTDTEGDTRRIGGVLKALWCVRLAE